MTPINFKANFLKTVYIPHTTSKGISEKEVSIVELDKNDKKDIDALTEIAWKWEDCASGYAFEIFNDARKYKPYPDVYKEHYLALTTQKSDYANLEPDKVLGLALFEEKVGSCDELAWLQANPMTNHECKKRKYNNIGKSLVDYIKTLTYKPIVVSSDDKAIEFYEKQGFKHTGKYPSQLIYEA